MNSLFEVSIEKKWRTQNFDFVSLKFFLQVSFRWTPTHAGIIQFSNFLFQLKNQRSGSKSVYGFSIIFIFEGSYDVLKSKNWCFKNEKNKSETQLKVENLQNNFKGVNLVLQLA